MLSIKSTLDPIILKTEDTKTGTVWFESLYEHVAKESLSSPP